MFILQFSIEMDRVLIFFIGANLIPVVQRCHPQFAVGFCHTLFVLLSFEKRECLTMVLQSAPGLAGDEKPVPDTVKAVREQFGVIQFQCQFFRWLLSLRGRVYYAEDRSTWTTGYGRQYLASPEDMTDLQHGTVTWIDAAMSQFSGVVRCDTLISNSVVSASYTPGAGNVW